MSNKFFQKGIITLQTILYIGTPIGAMFGGYFGNIAFLNKKITDSEKAIMIEVNEDRLDIMKNTTNIDNIDQKLKDINSKLDTLISKL